MDDTKREDRTLKIAISGASGFVGAELVKTLVQKGYQVIKLVRKRTTDKADEVCLDPDVKFLDTKGLENVDVVINLAGKNIAEGRWNKANKIEIKDSRVKLTKLLANSFSKVKNPPRLFLSASAIGYYGNRGDDVLTESAKPGSGFLSQVCREWELATWEAEAIGITVNHLRFGIILSPEGGALKPMLPMFRMGLGATLGKGEQFMSWITREDVIGAILFLIENPQPSGPINMVAPAPVTNKDFTKALAQALRRPAAFSMPESVIRFMFGEKGETLFLESTRVLPENLTKAGYEFKHPEITKALSALLL